MMQTAQGYEKIFGLLIPGSLPIMDFQVINGMLVCDLLNPASVTTVSFFQTAPLPEGYAGALYYSMPPFENLQFIGAIGNTRPSDIFYTGFALNPDVNQLEIIKLVMYEKSFKKHFNAYLTTRRNFLLFPKKNNRKIEPLTVLKDLILLANSNDIQKEYAKKVAQNLYNFMNSFNKQGMMPGHIGSDYLVIPSNILDRWIVKFEEKYKHDPNFIMKSSLE